ncbi:MAG: hypothetical protein ACLVC1_05180 [Mediterraneibacter gnavus]
MIVENMGDTPFSALLNKAQLAALTAATLAVKNAVNIPVGVVAAFEYCRRGKYRDRGNYRGIRYPSSGILWIR